MRGAMIIQTNGRPVGGVGHTRPLREMVADRVANGEASPGETVVRLPRRMTRLQRWENEDAMWSRLERWCRARPGDLDANGFWKALGACMSEARS